MLDRITVLLFMAAILVLSIVVNKRDQQILKLKDTVKALELQSKDLEYEIDWQRELTRTQEDWLRSCGFYGKED